MARKIEIFHPQIQGIGAGLTPPRYHTTGGPCLLSGARIIPFDHLFLFAEAFFTVTSSRVPFAMHFFLTSHILNLLICPNLPELSVMKKEKP
jgi:hypothetical protein